MVEKYSRGKGIKNRSFGHFAEKKEKEVFNIGLYCWLGQDHPPLPLALLGRQYNGDCFHHGTPHYGHYSSTGGEIASSNWEIFELKARALDFARCSTMQPLTCRRQQKTGVCSASSLTKVRPFCKTS